MQKQIIYTSKAVIYYYFEAFQILKQWFHRHTKTWIFWAISEDAKHNLSCKNRDSEKAMFQDLQKKIPSRQSGGC